jgi:hypothetical protein
METTKLKVESFSIQFSNSGDDNRVYNIDARFEKQTSGNENIEASIAMETFLPTSTKTARATAILSHSTDRHPLPNSRR